MIFKNYCRLGEASVVYEGIKQKTIIGVCDLSDGMAMWRCKHCSVMNYKCKYLSIHKFGDDDFVANCESLEALAESIDAEIGRLNTVYEALQDAIKINVENG